MSEIIYYYTVHVVPNHRPVNVLPWDVIELLFLLPKKKFSPDRNMAQNSKEFVNSDNLLLGVFDTVIDISYR